MDTLNKQNNQSKLQLCSKEELEELYGVLENKIRGKTPYKSLKYVKSLASVLDMVDKQKLLNNRNDLHN